MNKITADTLVPLSLLVALTGGIAWLSNMAVKSSIVYAKVDKMEEAAQHDLENNNRFQKEVLERLGRIEQALNIGRK
jgi:hypothetical protein